MIYFPTPLRGSKRLINKNNFSLKISNQQVHLKYHFSSQLVSISNNSRKTRPYVSSWQSHISSHHQLFQSLLSPKKNRLSLKIWKNTFCVPQNTHKKVLLYHEHTLKYMRGRKTQCATRKERTQQAAYVGCAVLWCFLFVDTWNHFSSIYKCFFGIFWHLQSIPLTSLLWS